MTLPPTPSALAIAGEPVEARLREFLEQETSRWAAIDPSLQAPLDALADLVMSGGKRLRPAFVHWGHVAAGGDPFAPEVTNAGAAVELLHAFALAHDDVMDGSASRRGQPTTHVSFALHHRDQDWSGDSDHFGESVAMLVGDLAYAYADVLMAPRDPSVAQIWDHLRVEVNIGQYLDVLAEAKRHADEATARRILEYKTGRYSVQRPLQLGVALAGGSNDLLEGIVEYGRPVGLAFQLRDDLLDAFGETEQTGKPVGSDLRDGKPTPLLAAARNAATPEQAKVINGVGNSTMTQTELANIQQAMMATGAPESIENEIGQLYETACHALDKLSVSDVARDALVELARFVAYRQH